MPGNRLLMIGFRDRGVPLRQALLELGFLPFEAMDLAEAACEFERGTPLSSVVLLSTAIPRRGLRSDLERLRRLRQGLEVIAVGPEPGHHATRELHDAGVTTGLWAPYEPEDLRLVLTLSSPPDREIEPRDFCRVPTRIAATLVAAGDETSGTIRNLSAAGLFVETKAEAGFERGDDFEIAFTLGDDTLRLDASAVYVTPISAGDHATRGIGAKLVQPPPAALSQLADYVILRLSAFRF